MGYSINLYAFLEGPVFDVDCIVKDGELLDCVSRVRQLKNPLSPYSTGHKVELNSTVIEYAKRYAVHYAWMALPTLTS